MHVRGILLAIFLSEPAFGLTLPPGFAVEELGASGGWDGPVGLAFAPDGRTFVAERRGRVHVVRNGVKLADPFVEIESEVLNNGDRGLLGIALDPSFAGNGFVYLLYTVDPNQDGIDGEGPAFGRLARYTASSSNPDVADPASRRVLLGATWPTGVPALSGTHTIGCLRFGLDGSLFVSTGDGANGEILDPGGKHAGGFGAGKTPATEDIGAFRAQMLGSLAGKILRIDPSTGAGLPDNPFFTGDPLANASRVWAYGLRNPYRLTVRPGSGMPGPGTLYIGDVGWATWEEVSVARRGSNLGWPCREGPAASQYATVTPAHHGCDTIGTPENPSQPAEPLTYWHHTDPTLSALAHTTGRAPSGIAFYTGDTYPPEYRGACFVVDSVGGWMKALFVDSEDRLVEVRDFATDIPLPVDLVAEPVSGDLCLISITANRIWRIRYDPLNRPPVAIASASPSTGEAPLGVTFSSDGSLDPDNDPLRYRWYFGDGESGEGPGPTHTYRVPGDYTAILTAEDGRGGQASATVPIVVADGTGALHPPEPTILSPYDGEFFLPQGEILLRGDATDAEDPPSALAYSWEIVLHHNVHIHPAWLRLDGQVASFVPGDHDDGSGYALEIVLRVRDSDGLTGSRAAMVYPGSPAVLLDDGGPGTSSRGTWSLSGADYPWGARSLYSKTTGHTYTFRVATPSPGAYKAFAWWTAWPSRAEAVPFAVTHARGTDTVSRDQRVAGGQWSYLGTWVFDEFASITVGSVGGDKSTCADAVCLVPAPGARFPPAAHIDRVAPNPAEPGQEVSFLGHGDGASAIVLHEWTSSLDGPIGSEASFASSALSEGTHAISYRVRDDAGLWSEPVALEILVAIPSTPGSEIVLDDGDPGTSSTGSWPASGGSNPWDGSSVYSKGTGATYTFDLALPQAGSYEVHAWWTQIASRSPTVPYAMTTTSGTQTVSVDQRSGGGRWNLLGTFVFGSRARITVTSRGGGYSTCADAVRLVPVSGAGSGPRILDTGEPGTSSTGTWLASGGANPYGAGSLYAKSSVSTYSWRFDALEPGEYEVAAWWTVIDSRSTSVPYVVTHESGTAEVTRSQRTGGGQWNVLGTYRLGASATVEVQARADGKSYCADAIRLTRLGP